MSPSSSSLGSIPDHGFLWSYSGSGTRDLVRICMIVLNNFTHDARVLREARTLGAAGHDVLVLAVQGPGLPKRELTSHFTVIRVPIRTRRWPRSTLTQVIKYLEYFWRTLYFALIWQADVYHAHNAKALWATWLMAQRTRARLGHGDYELEAGCDTSFCSTRWRR